MNENLEIIKKNGKLIEMNAELEYINHKEEIYRIIRLRNISNRLRSRKNKKK